MSIPAGWRRARLGEIADVAWGDTSTTKASYTESGFRAYSASGPDGYLPNADYHEPGIVLSAIGAQAGRTWLARGDWSCIKNTIRVLADPTVASVDYLYYATRIPEHWPKRGSAQPFITQGDARAVVVPFPSLPEQQAIAEVLGGLDDKIAANTALAATAEQTLRAEIDAEWLRGDDRSSTLADYVELNPKVPAPRAASAIYVDMKRLPESGWSIDGYDFREPKGGARFTNGDTLMARITPCLENRKAGFVDHLRKGEIGVGSTEFIVLRTRDGIAPPIAFLLATAPRFRDHAIQHMIGTSGRQRVAAFDLAGFALPRPNSAWLAEFGARVEELFAAVAAQSAENRTLAAIRDALLPQLVSGKLRVRGAHRLGAVM